MQPGYREPYTNMMVDQVPLLIIYIYIMIVDKFFPGYFSLYILYILYSLN